MAGDWIKLETVTPDKPEVLALAEFLGITPEHALGCLIRLWIWADQQSIDGDAIRVTAAQIDRISCYANVTQGLAHVGWLRELSTPQGTYYTLPNFTRHNGKSAKNRALTKSRMAKFRDAKVTLQASPEKRRVFTNTIPSTNSTAANDRPAGKPDGISQGQNPTPAAHSLEKAQAAIQESRQAIETAAPIPEHVQALIARLRPGKRAADPLPAAADQDQDDPIPF